MADELTARVRAAIDIFPPVVRAGRLIAWFAHTTPGGYVFGALMAGFGWYLAVRG